MRCSLRKFVTIFLACLIVLIAGLIIAVPVPSSISQPTYSPVLFADDGELLGARVAEDGQWRLQFSGDLPKNYLNALLSFEDKRFYYHPGVDPLAIVRAAFANLSHGKIVSGASTLTMQLARLSYRGQPRTLQNKLKETALAIKLEWIYSKQEILLLYANLAPFGGNTVGIQSAAWRYFGVPVDALSHAEASLLAVLPKNPSDLRLGKNRTQLLQRRDHLLRRLATNGSITEQDLKLALLEPLPSAPKRLADLAPHWFNTLRKQHSNNTQLHSTIDFNVQKHVNLIAENHLPLLQPFNAANLAIVVIDNAERAVIGYVGNHTRTHHGAAQVDIASRPRSSGSLFKPFLYALMLQRGDILTQTLILDIPTYYRGYQPQNYDRHYRGAVRASEAIRQSLNVPSVRMLQRYGVAAFRDDLIAMGLTTLFRNADAYGLSLILGGAETNLLEMATSYSLLMQSASGQPPRTIKRLKADEATTTTFPINQGAAWLTINTLKELNRPGVQSHWKAFQSSPDIAWKTGTSYGLRDAWAIGSNRRFTVAVWAGNANGEEGLRLSGSQTAAPIMLDVFRALPKSDLPPMPKRQLKTYSVCSADGFLSRNGCQSMPAWAPIEANFTQQSPYHQRIFVDNNGQRVHGHCESPFNMKPLSIFALSPIAGFYYRQNHVDMPTMPVWRDDCAANLPTGNHAAQHIAIEYPAEGARIKLPKRLDGSVAPLVVKARHHRADSILFWHVGKKYLGKTQGQHEFAFEVTSGWHQLILVDSQGAETKRWFKVM